MEDSDSNDELQCTTIKIAVTNVNPWFPLFVNSFEVKYFCMMDKEKKFLSYFKCKMLLEFVIGKDKWMRIGFRYLLLELWSCNLNFYVSNV